MGFFDFFKLTDINSGVEEYKNTNGAVLLDVRTEEEYAQGHIERSINVPVENINVINEVVENKKTPLFVYCYSGGRSGNAVAKLKRMGYTCAKNIGGIMNYRGKVEGK